MYYELSDFMQKLSVGSSRLRFHSCDTFHGLRPLVSREEPPIIFVMPSKLTTSPTAYDYAGKNKVPEIQKFFQESNGVHIHLK
uniref:Uncharacterized protein n=1 Tax=Marmota marmota marmota TaxID=9994 RepID=A0A8C6A0K6_MARMA